MNTNTPQQDTQQRPPFTLKLIEPFQTLHHGVPVRIPYIVDGLLTQGGFSALGGKPKHGKSSMARYEAVCVAKGMPFLGRNTIQGEVILINLEDPLNHVDNCLKVLQYDPNNDARIHIVDKLSPSIEENIDVISRELAKRKEVRLVIVDHLAKFLRVKDLNEYMPVMTGVEKLRNLARSFPHLHVQGIAHCKKLKTDDPFDSILGSTALRGEPDTNVALYGEDGQRVIATETRIGRNLPTSILRAELVESAGADVVKDFILEESLDEWQSRKNDKVEKKRKETYEERIIAYLRGCDDQTAQQEAALETVEGRRASKIAAIEALKQAGVVEVTGVKQSPNNPLTLHLNSDALSLYDLGNKLGGRVN